MQICLNDVAKIRGFNRFYTGILGLLNSKIHMSDFSLSEARVLFELGKLPGISSKDLSKQLRIDPAYLSRMLSRFVKQGLILKEKSLEDTRRHVLFLSRQGESVLTELQEMSNSHIAASLAHATKEDHNRLVKAMNTIEKIFSDSRTQNDSYFFRSHRSGDIGFIAYRHAIFYSESYGFDTTFDAYVALGLAKFVENYDSHKEHLWVVEDDVKRVGSIAIVKAEEDVAQLRWFLLEPCTRGKGLGKKMLAEAVEFCRSKNYKKIILWTVNNLSVARQLYDKFGFQVVENKSHQIWGQYLTEELWEMKLK